MEQLSSYFAKLAELRILSEYRIQDALDIIILTILIYRLMFLIRGTRTMYILYGMLFIVFGAFIASEMQLLGVTLLFNSFLNSIVIIIVIIFQSDFRNALAKIGRRNFLRDQTNGINQFYSIFEKAIEQLSYTRTGALFVFERVMDTKNMQHGGISLDSIPSIPLIISLFDKNVPTHDGAMIINSKNKIKLVGAILPLTVNIEKRVEYGTRHRAAIGISEETDAVAVVVSEQTGKISYTHSGTIHVIELAQLKNTLTKLLN